MADDTRDPHAGCNAAVHMLLDVIEAARKHAGDAAYFEAKPHKALDALADVRSGLSGYGAGEEICRCGHRRDFHAPGLGCSGSHNDSMPCMTFDASMHDGVLDA